MLSKKYIIIGLLFVSGMCTFCLSCHQPGHTPVSPQDIVSGDVVFDSAAVPQNPYGAAILYGRQLMINTAYYIGPGGTNGQYLGNNMSCSNCHQNGGIKPGSFSLVHSHDEYPQYRAREAKILSLADRVNNCINRPMNGKSLPYDSREMIALLSYLKWISDAWKEDTRFDKSAHTPFGLTDIAASPQRGAALYQENCSRCHGGNGEGVINTEHNRYVYPPLWGDQSYQTGSSLHRVIKMAGWLKGNMPYDKVTPGKPFLSDQQALDIAAFINDDDLHQRPVPVGQKDYPDIHTKPVDYGHGPYIDSFSQVQHKFGPYPPIISYLKSKHLNASY